MLAPSRFSCGKFYDMKMRPAKELEEGAQCKVIGGTHEGKSGTVTDIKTGKTGHMGKMLRIVRILDTFPKQQFVLFGDNSQSDPAIYASLAAKMKGRIHAVYIRNIRSSKSSETAKILEEISQTGVCTCLFNHSNEAIEHSKKIGLI